MLRYHINSKGEKIVEVIPDSGLITSSEDVLDIMVEAGYNGCNHILLHEMSLHPDFFDLKTGLAGEILQKFSNYRMRLSVIGHFARYKSKSLKAFITESNKRGIVSFIGSLDEVITLPDQ